MQISQVELQNFRLHANLRVEFAESIQLLVGANGSGKSSVLEAIATVATGTSVRATQVSEMVQLGAELARVKVSFTVGSGESREIELILTRGEVQGKRTAGKLWSVNGVRRAQRAAVGQLRVVLFRPEDLRLIEGSPSRRREYLDQTLLQLFPNYRTALSTYESMLVRRNKLLEAIREGEQPASVLSYWTMGILKHGAVLQQLRRAFVAQVNTLLLQPAFQLEYLPSVLDEERLATYAQKEIAAGHTLIGPHKDDFDIWLPNSMITAPTGSVSATKENSTVPAQQPAGSDSTGAGVSGDERLGLTEHYSAITYGSRGQQRLAVLWLKLAQLQYLENVGGEKPVLLLDDIFSELDTDSRNLVKESVTNYQTIICATPNEELELIFPNCQQVSLSVS